MPDLVTLFNCAGAYVDSTQIHNRLWPVCAVVIHVIGCDSK